MGLSFSGYIHGVANQNNNVINDPEIVDGLIPVSLSKSGSIARVADTNREWYNYSMKKWANGVLVKEDGTFDCNVGTCHTREYYETHPGGRS